MIEKAYFIKSSVSLSFFPSDAKRIYLGSDYCIKAFPSKFGFLLSLAKISFPVTLLIPPLLESELKIFDKYLKIFLEFADSEDEIIFNDLGALKIVSSLENKNFKIGIGRFYSYQKRGVQKLYNAIQPEDLIDVPILDKETISFLRNLGVERIEIDAVPYGLNILETYGMKISLYENNLLTSYTINCPYTYTGNYWGRKCNRQCLINSMILRSEEATSDIYQVGKAFYQNTIPSKTTKIDRIVSFSWKPNQINK